MSFCLNLSTDLESLSLSRWLSSHCSLHLHALLFWFFHLENKPSQRSAEMLARFQSSHCLVLGVHLLTCSTNTLQILIKAKFSTCTLLPEILSHILERHINTQCLAHGLFWEVWPWMMNRLSYNYLHRLGVTYREVWPDLQFVITEMQKPSNLLTK